MTLHELTEEEVRDRFLDHMRGIVRYWLNEARTPDVREKLEGAVFSVLVALDGGSDLPAFTVAPRPHPTDRHYCESNGQNWYPAAPIVSCDISGSLHELFSKATR